MSKSLTEVKNVLAGRYLGKEGIHGFGISRAQNALKVYVELQNDAAQQKTLDEIKKQAHPYTVIQIDASKPYLTS